MVCYLLVALLVTDGPRWWLAIGIAFGIALETKYQVLALGLGVAVGMLLTPVRRQLRTPWPWVGLALAAVVFLSNVVWQVQQGWPSLAYTLNHRTDIAGDGPRYIFVLEQLLLIGPVSLPLFGIGLWSLFRKPHFRNEEWGKPVLVCEQPEGR